MPKKKQQTLGRSIIYTICVENDVSNYMYGLTIFIHLQRDCKMFALTVQSDDCRTNLSTARLLPCAILSRQMLWKAQRVIGDMLARLI